METEERAYELLRGLVQELTGTIDEGIAKGVLKPTEETYFVWRLKNFTYGDDGPRDEGAQGENAVRTSWSGAVATMIKTIRESMQWKDALEYLGKLFEIKTAENALNSFTIRIALEYLEKKKTDETELSNLMQGLLGGLRGEPQIIRAEVFLDGVVLRPDTVKITHDIVLRKTRKEDFETEIRRDFAVGFSMPPYLRPSAVMEVERLVQQPFDMQKIVEQVMVLLKLFAVGGVKYLQYTVRSDSFVGFPGQMTISSRDYAPSQDKYVISEENVARLKRFWQNLLPILPQRMYSPTMGKEDYTIIAYTRYGEALSPDNLIERRITNGIMGLEGLLLKRNEIQELVFRLSSRAAKVLSFFGYNPHEVQKVIKDAYRVRNVFAHGGQLNYDERRKLEEKYQDIRLLLKKVLDYLRMCIIIHLSLLVDKEAFIDTIDASFIDNKVDSQLAGHVNPARTILGIS